MLNKLRNFLLVFIMIFSTSTASGDNNKLAYDFVFKDLDGSELSLSSFKSKVIIVINVASKCGFTNQYDDMQKLWEKYQSKGIIMIGVPSNDFGKQEPGTNKEIKNFCESRFGITFPMTGKVSVKGPSAHPFYIWAKENHGNSAVPKWNFHKIIIDRSGKIDTVFTSITNPSSKKFTQAIENLL